MKNRKILSFCSIILAVVLFACEKERFSADNTSQGKPASQLKSAYTGEDLFRAIFLCQGELSEKIGLYESTRAMLAEREKDEDFRLKRIEVANELVDAINQSDPTYFDELYASVESQDINQIDATVNKGVNHLISYLDTQYPKDPVTGEPAGIQQCLAAVVVVAVVVWEAAAAVNVAAAVSVWVWKWAKFWGYSTPAGTDPEVTAFEKEAFLANVSQLLIE